MAGSQRRRNDIEESGDSEDGLEADDTRGGGSELGDSRRDVAPDEGGVAAPGKDEDGSGSRVGLRYELGKSASNSRL